MNSISLQRVCRSRGIVRFKLEVEVFPLIHELDRWVLLVYEFQVKELAARPNTCVKSWYWNSSVNPTLVGKRLMHPGP